MESSDLHVNLTANACVQTPRDVNTKPDQGSDTEPDATLQVSNLVTMETDSEIAQFLDLPDTDCISHKEAGNNGHMSQHLSASSQTLTSTRAGYPGK